MISLLSSVAGLVKAKTKFGTTIDGAVARLHYRFTTALLFAFCLLVTATSYLGDAINCVSDGTVPQHVINTYCWIHSTYTLTKHFDKEDQVGKYILATGLGNHSDRDEKVFHLYYQWVPFLLFLQGCLFYAPHWIWKALEGDKIKDIVKGLCEPTMREVERKKRQKLLVNYLVSSKGTHGRYAFLYHFCEFLYLFNVIGNMFLLDRFLRGEFFNYGMDVLEFTTEESTTRSDPMILLFPRQTKCTFHKFGVSGTVERVDSLCILALNILHEKVFIMLWFWFIFLTIVTAFNFLYKLIKAIPVARVWSIHKSPSIFNLGRINSASTIVSMTSYSDVLLLELILRNIDSVVSISLLKDLSMRLKNYGYNGLEIATDLALYSTPGASGQSSPGQYPAHYGIITESKSVYATTKRRAPQPPLPLPNPPAYTTHPRTPPKSHYSKIIQPYADAMELLEMKSSPDAISSAPPLQEKNEE